MKDSSYRLVIFAQFEEGEQMLEFDYANDNNVDTRSSISQHPILDGSSMADHMWREPVTESVSGTFSLNGNRVMDYSGPYDRLTNIQELFERIKNEAVFCTLTKLSRSDDTAFIFKQRTNMVLTGISWTEKQNSVDFNFSFTEALTASVQEADVIVDATDPSLPAITDPASTSLSEANVINYSDIMSATIKILLDCGLIAENALECIASVVASSVVASSIAAVGTIILIASICGSLAAAVPVGTIIVAVVAVAAAIGAAIWSLVNFFQRKSYKIQGFWDFTLGVVTKDMTRFFDFMQEIYDEVYKLEQYCKCFTFIADGNQESALYIDGMYYVFTFIKNEDGFYSLKVTDINETEIYGCGRFIGLATISDCTNTNKLFSTHNSGMKVYALNNVIYNIDKSTDDAEEKAAQIDAAQQVLTNFVIFVTSLDMDKFNDLIVDIIKNKIGC